MFIEMDENVTLADQLQKGGKDDRRSVILRNKVNVKLNNVRGLLEAWAADAAYLKQKLGFISAQLHRGISGSCVFVNYAVWESVEASIRLPVILLLGRLSRVIQKALRERTINYPNGYSYLIVRSSTSKRRRSISRAC